MVTFERLVVCGRHITSLQRVREAVKYLEMKKDGGGVNVWTPTQLKIFFQPFSAWAVWVVVAMADRGEKMMQRVHSCWFWAVVGSVVFLYVIS